MEKTVKMLCRVLPALLLLAGGMFSSCVKEESSPFGQNSVDAKLPYPDYSLNWKAGDEILLKGSGFTSADEIYVQAVYDEVYEDYDIDGNEMLEVKELSPKVQARIARVSDTELVFVVPGAMYSINYPGQGMNHVYLRRNGQEHLLGLYYYNTSQFLSGTVQSGNSLYIYTDFLDGDAMYLSYFDIDPETKNFVLKGERYPIDLGTPSSVSGTISYWEYARCPYAVGDMVLVHVRNGEEITPKTYGYPENVTLTFPTYYIYMDNTLAHSVILQWEGFTEDDRIVLRNDQTGEETEAPIIYRDDERLQFDKPESEGSYSVVLQRAGEVKVDLDKTLTIY